MNNLFPAICWCIAIVCGVTALVLAAFRPEPGAASVRPARPGTTGRTQDQSQGWAPWA